MVLVSSLSSVRSQVEVHAYIGDTVLLPCSASSPPPPSVKVYWRDRNNKNVLDIENNKQDFQTQSDKFKNRVESFPELYAQGNFSIILKDVQQEDASVYECHIQIDQVSLQRVRLNVTGHRPKVVTTPSGPAGGAAAVTPSSILLLSLCLLLGHHAALNSE